MISPLAKTFRCSVYFRLEQGVFERDRVVHNGRSAEVGAAKTGMKRQSEDPQQAYCENVGDLERAAIKDGCSRLSVLNI